MMEMLQAAMLLQRMTQRLPQFYRHMSVPRDHAADRVGHRGTALVEAEAGIRSVQTQVGKPEEGPRAIELGFA